MGLWNMLFGGAGAAPSATHSPFEPLQLMDLAARAARAEPAVADVDPEQALPALQHRAQVDPTDAVVLAGVACAQLAIGEFADGITTWNQAIFHANHDPKLAYEGYRIKGFARDIHLGQTADAIDHYAVCEQIDPHAAPLKLWKIDLALRSGDHRTAKVLLNQLVKAGLTGVHADIEAAYHGDDHEGAFELLQVADRIDQLQLVRRAWARTA